jgi:polyhydroxybutyrate depolymerase
MYHFHFLSLFILLSFLPADLSVIPFSYSAMAWNFQERRLERQLKREERRLERRQFGRGIPPLASSDLFAKTISVDDLERSYLFFKPTASHNSKIPLVVALHGGKTSALTFLRTSRFNDLALNHNFAVVYPNAINGYWNDGRSNAPHNHDDTKFLISLIDYLVLSQNVDPMRVYVTGISNGSFMAQRLACLQTNRIAAISIVAGAMPTDLALTCRPTRPMPVILFSGTLDTFIPWQGGQMSKGVGGSLLSPSDTAKWWATHNGCLNGRSIPFDNSNNPLLDNTKIEQLIFSGCDLNADVSFYKILGGGHTWPNGYRQPKWLVGSTTRRIDASVLSWNFFSSYRR